MSSAASSSVAMLLLECRSAIRKSTCRTKVKSQVCLNSGERHKGHAYVWRARSVTFGPNNKKLESIVYLN